MENNVIIDSLTDCLICSKTGKEYNTEFRMVTTKISEQVSRELKKQGWQFDWSKPQEEGYEIYQLMLENDNEIQGMIALKHIENQYYTHINIVESAPHNVGKTGKYKGVGAHLFAIACKLSWEKGNEGYVYFTAKSNLIEHYKEYLNAKELGGQRLYIDSYGANYLIKKYFKE